MRFLLKCSEITAENNKRQFFKRVFNILCKVTGNGLHYRWCHLWWSVSILGWHCQFSKRLTLVIRAQGGHIEHRL